MSTVEHDIAGAEPPAAETDPRTGAAPASDPTSDSDLPVERFLNECHRSFKGDQSGALADYIPELTKANPDHFGIAITTVDGHTHTVGDTDEAFTIQSVSKAFVFALALEFCGHDRIGSKIGVEPSGDTFNSIRLKTDNRPFNPMVNAGAIACTGLIQSIDPEGAFERIRLALSDFAGRDLGYDEAVYGSESQTGDRNRAIAWLLKNNGVLDGDVDASLDVYFRQCALLVTAKDLSVMGATLANNGVNPVTGIQVLSTSTIAKTLSVMVSAGMYDFSGEWIYRVGLPAKSGVGGGIVAALPAQLGLGTYSALLDDVGNSARGVKVCEEVSAQFGLHLLERQGDVRTSVAADYDLGEISSTRDRNPRDAAILRRYGRSVRVLELAGALNFVGTDYISRRLSAALDHEIVIFDFRRVSGMSAASAKLFGRLFQQLLDSDKRAVVSGLNDASTPGHLLWTTLDEETAARIRAFPSMSEAASWAEDQVIFLYGGFDHMQTATHIADQPLLKSLPSDQIQILLDRMTEERVRPGSRIIEAGLPGDSVYFLQSGMVSVVLASGVRVASIDAGNCFGEMALISPEERRSAHVDADTDVSVITLPLEAFDAIREAHPLIAETIMRNLAQLLSERLRQANSKIEALAH